MLCEQLLCHKSFSLNNFCDVSSGIREVQCQPWFESFGDAVVRIITSIFVLLKKKKRKRKTPQTQDGLYPAECERAFGGRCSCQPWGESRRAGRRLSPCSTACRAGSLGGAPTPACPRESRASPSTPGMASALGPCDVSPPRRAVPPAGSHRLPVSLSASAA